MSVCILLQMVHVRIPNLIYPNHPCTHIVDQYEHFEANPALSSLFVHKLILNPWERCLNHAHPPLSCLLRQCCLLFSVDPISSLDISVLKNQIGPGMIWRGIPFHLSKGWVDATLCLCWPENIPQLAINIPILRNLTVVNQPWYVRESNWICPVRTKAKIQMWHSGRRSSCCSKVLR